MMPSIKPQADDDVSEVFVYEAENPSLVGLSFEGDSASDWMIAYLTPGEAREVAEYLTDKARLPMRQGSPSPEEEGGPAVSKWCPAPSAGAGCHTVSESVMRATTARGVVTNPAGRRPADNLAAVTNPDSEED